MLRCVTFPLMKTNRIALSVVFFLAGAAGVFAAKDKPAPRTEVTFSEPEKFTDAADGPRGTDSGRDQNLEELRNYIVEHAQRYVAEGQKLSVTITDVDLAGEVEPWRNPSGSDIRFVKPIYSPKIDLTFRLTDASGAVVKEGKRQLRDMSFDMKLRVDRNDPRVYEKGLLDDWIRDEFRAKKK